MIFKEVEVYKLARGSAGKGEYFERLSAVEKVFWKCDARGVGGDMVEDKAVLYREVVHIMGYGFQ